MLWTELPVHVIDFEGSVRTGVVEFGVVTLAGDRIESTSTRMSRPRRAIPAEEARVHGLTDGAVETVEPFDAEWGRFARLRATGLLAAHFSAAESSILRTYWPFPRLSPNWLESGKEMAEWGPWIDTGRIASEVLPAGSSAALSEVVNALDLGEDLETEAAKHCPAERCHFHCALFDAIACALILCRIACNADGTHWTLARLAALSTANRNKREARVQPRLPGF